MTQRKFCMPIVKGEVTHMRLSIRKSGITQYFGIGELCNADRLALRCLRCICVAAVIILSAAYWMPMADAVESRTVVNADQFVVVKNGVVYLNDSFSDLVPPPQTEATYPGGTPVSLSVRGVFGTGCNPNEPPTTQCIDVGGKTTMDSDLGRPAIRNLFSSTGAQIFANDLTRSHFAILLTNRSNNLANLAQGLKVDDDIQVLGLFDLVPPVGATTNYGIGLDDRPDLLTGGFLGRNDALRLSVIRRTSTLETVVSFFRFEQGAGPGGADLVTGIARSAPFTAAEFSNAQILLRLTTPANDSTVTAEYAFVNSPIDISDAVAVGALSFITLPNTDTIFDGELWTRARIRLVQRVDDIGGVEMTSGGSPTSISQDVDTDTTPVELIFNYRFDTPTGALTVSLDGTVLGTIVAPDPVTSGFGTARILVDGALLGLTDLELKFEIDGPDPSIVKIDNILFPGLLDGNFATGDLSSWTVLANGTGSATAFNIRRVEPADIDIMPGSDLNPINTKSPGVVPVALLGKVGLDVTSITQVAATFGTTPASEAHDLSDPQILAQHLRQVDGDGVLDLVLHFSQKETGLTPADTEACLQVHTDVGSFGGCDVVRVK